MNITNDKPKLMVGFYKGPTSQFHHSVIFVPVDTLIMKAHVQKKPLYHLKPRPSSNLRSERGITLYFVAVMTRGFIFLVGYE